MKYYLVRQLHASFLGLTEGDYYVPVFSSREKAEKYADGKDSIEVIEVEEQKEEEE